MYIMTLGTISKYRHCGLATKLANICIQLAANIPSCGVIYLHVITGNNIAIRLYEKLGFQRIHIVNDYYQIKGQNYNAFLYAKFMNGNYNSNYHYLKLLWTRILTVFDQVKKV